MKTRRNRREQKGDGVGGNEIEKRNSKEMKRKERNTEDGGGGRRGMKRSKFKPNVQVFQAAEQYPSRCPVPTKGPWLEAMTARGEPVPPDEHPPPPLHHQANNPPISTASLKPRKQPWGKRKDEEQE